MGISTRATRILFEQFSPRYQSGAIAALMDLPNSVRSLAEAVARLVTFNALNASSDRPLIWRAAGRPIFKLGLGLLICGLLQRQHSVSFAAGALLKVTVVECVSGSAVKAVVGPVLSRCKWKL